MRWYLDASAATKLLSDETESDALRGFMDSRVGDDPVLSSAILETELRRVAHRESLDQRIVSAQLDRIELVLPERDDYRAAGLLAVGALRALDSLHLQTALRARVEAMIVYDRRLAEACRELGLRTVAPT